MQERISLHMSIRRFHIFPVVVLFATVLSFSGTALNAQDSDFKLELHANKHASAAEIGLPAYPGATLVKETDDDSNTADLGFTFGNTHFRLMVAKYTTTDTPDRVLDFYRKPLSRYGVVLECNHGKPVGSLTVTTSGLNCSEKKGAGITVSDQGLSTSGHELLVGSPHHFRIVAIDDSYHQSTRFWLVFVELPKDHEKKE
jgi:hypothetical protein